MNDFIDIMNLVQERVLEPDQPREDGAWHSGRQKSLKATKPRIKLIAFNAIQLGTTRRDLVKGLIPRVGLTVVWGPPKSGKSFWVFDVFMHVAAGMSYRGRKVHQGPVVYCAFEGQSGFGARKEAFRQRFLSEGRDLVPFYLQPFTLNLVAERDALLAAIRAELGIVQPVAIALDTLNRSLCGSESSDEDMSAYVRAADAIREAFNCAVIIVHHCGIDSTRPRGHTALTGAADAQIAVKRDANGNVIATLECAKDGPQGETIASRLEVVDVGVDEDGECISSCVVVATEADPRAAAAAKVRGAARIALDQLKQALIHDGEVSSTSNYIPPGTRTTSVESWRRYCYAGTISESSDQTAKQKAFVRASKRLQERGAVSVWNDRVWLTGHAGH